MEVLQAALIHVHEPVVSVRVSWNQEETVLKDKITGVADDALDHLVIVKMHSYPETRNNGCILMEVKRLMTDIPVERLDEKHRLSVAGRDLFDLARIDQAKPERVQRRMRIVAQQLLDRSKFIDQCRTADRAVLKPNNDTVNTLGRRSRYRSDLSGYARSCGDRSYCLILYSNAL